MTAPIVHFEFAGPDEHALHSFYGGVFGWAVNEMGPGYALVETPDGSPNGGLREAEVAEFTIGVEVDDLEEAVARGVEFGGSLAMPPTDNGYVNKAQLTDPAGNIVTLIAANKSEARK